MMFTWQWLQFYAVNNTDIDEWFWGAKDIDCSINETAIHCYNRKDNNTMFHATENLLKNDPVLTFVHLGKANTQIVQHVIIYIARSRHLTPYSSVAEHMQLHLEFILRCSETNLCSDI